jgi:hypothetical protein
MDKNIKWKKLIIKRSFNIIWKSRLKQVLQINKKELDSLIKMLKFIKINSIIK